MVSDICHECVSLMRSTAAKLKQATSENTDYLLKAKDLEERAQKVTQKRTYTNSWARRLLSWMGAKYTTTELVSNITQFESQVRCQLTHPRLSRKV